MDYKELASFIIEAVGGEANIVSLTHCATRLRFALKDDSIPDEKKIKAKNGVLGVSVNGGQYQIIMGNTVPKAYAAIMEQLDLKENSAGEGKKQKRKCPSVLYTDSSGIYGIKTCRGKFISGSRPGGSYAPSELYCITAGRNFLSYHYVRCGNTGDRM